MNLSIQADANSDAEPAVIKRPLINTPAIKFDKTQLYMSAVRGTTGAGYTFVIQNRSATSFKVVTESFIFSGADADRFEIVGGRIPRTVQPGAKAVFKVAFKPGASDSLSKVFTATLSFKASSAPTASGRINLRAIATQGEGGNLEPSLQRIMDLYGYAINVGDSDPSTTTLDLTAGATTDEIYAPEFKKAGTGPIQITPIAQFVSAAAVPGRLGYYTPGNPDDRTELFSLNNAFNQAASPEENGVLLFDPGTSPFSVYAQIPVFVDNGEPRRIYGEDALNTWDSNADNRRKVRVYQLKENGVAVDNAYVVTFEDYTTSNDQNDYVYVMRNVATVGSGPEIGLIAQGGEPFADTLSFNEIGTKNTTYPNRVLNQATVRVVNTGNRDLVISDIGLSGGTTSDFQIVSGGGAHTITRNGTLDVTVKFIATAGDLKTSSLVIKSNDSDEATKTVKLQGFWQSVSESGSGTVNQEPTLPELTQLLGFGTQTLYSGQSLDQGGATQTAGEEVLSGYWQQNDASYPIKVTDLATFHTQGNNDELAWYQQGQPFYGKSDPRYNASTNGPRNTLFFTGTNDGQTLLPRTTSNVSPATATFSTTGTFGWRLTGELSDDSLNIVKSGEQGGHHWRFYPARKSDGTYIPNTYFGVMDFSAINYDYNDNFFLIQNVRPANRTAAPAGVGAYSSNGDAVLDWDDVASATSYQVSRATSVNGAFSVLSSNVKNSFFVDSTADSGTTYYYRVLAVNSGGVASTPNQASVTV